MGEGHENRQCGACKTEQDEAGGKMRSSCHMQSDFGEERCKRLFRKPFCVWGHVVLSRAPYYLTLSFVPAFRVSSENLGQDLNLCFF